MIVRCLLEVQLEIPSLNETDLDCEFGIDANEIDNMESYEILELEATRIVTKIVKSEVVRGEKK